MERNDEKQLCSTNLTNEKSPHQKKHINCIKEDLSENDDVDIDENNEFLRGNDDNIRLMVENTLDEKKEHGWLIIEEDSDSSIDSDIDFYSSLSFKKYLKSKKNNSKTKNSTFGSNINEPISRVKEINNESDLPSSKLTEHMQHLTNSTLNNLYRPSCSTSIPSPSHSTNLPGPSCSTSRPGPSSSNNLPGPSCPTSRPGPSSSNNLPGPSCPTSRPGPSSSKNVPGPSCPTSRPGPSSSNNLPGPSCPTSRPGPSSSKNLPGPSCSTSRPGPSSSNNLPGPSCPTSIPGPSSSNKPDNLTTHTFNDDSNHTNLKLQREQQEKQLGSLKNTELNQNIELSNLEDCDLTKNYLSEQSRIEYSYKEPETNNTECFVEDPDIVNPDIMYNIDLKEYSNQLELLASKITEMPDDPTGLIEYKQLPPIPKIDQTHRKFTVEERFRFENGISEWEYQIDRDDWNKIMVKRAVVFTAHAGFSIANEESLYVLADVAIDYIKKLAVIMKKYFDIQAESTHPGNIDPIDYGLKEVGVQGGVRELIKHYEDDVFGRRGKLLRKCRYSKSIIDHHIVNVIKTVDDLEEESSTNEVGKNVISINMESAIKEKKTGIESGIEEVIVETQFSTDENIFTDTQVEQIDSLYVDNTDMEVKMDTGPRNIEYIKINASGIKRRKINYSITPDNSKVMGFDLLKPLDNVPTKKWIYSSGSEIYPVPQKSEKLLECTPKKVMKYLYSPLGVSPKVQSQLPNKDDGALGHSRMADQLDEDFNHYQDSLTENNIQTIYVHTLSDPDEAISMNDDNADYSADNTVQIIPVANDNDDSDSNIDYDIVSVDSFL